MHMPIGEPNPAPIHRAGTDGQIRFHMLEPADERAFVAAHPGTGAQAFHTGHPDGQNLAQRAWRQAFRNLPFQRFGAGAGAKQQNSAGCRKPIGQGGIGEGQDGRYDEPIPRKVGGRWQDIHILALRTQRGIGFKQQAKRVPVPALRLHLLLPDAGVLKQQCDRRTDGCHAGKGCNFAGNGAHFAGCHILHIVGCQQPGVHGFLRKRGLPPAKIAHQLRAMRKCLQRPQPHHARQRGGVPRRPVHWSRLLLHDAKSPIGHHGAIQIMVKRGEIRMALPQIVQLGFGIVPPLIQKTQRIAVPCEEIEVLRQRVVIKFGEEAHGIVGDETAR